MFISPAYASEAAAAGAGGGGLVSLLPLLLIIVVFYFMVIRPQSRRIAEHRDLINNLAKGDKIVTGGGLVGTVVKLVGTDEVQVRIAEGVEVTALRSTIMMLRDPDNKKKKHDTKKDK